MKYMFLVHLHEPKYGALSEHDLQALDDQAIEYVERLHERDNWWPETRSRWPTRRRRCACATAKLG